MVFCTNVRENWYKLASIGVRLQPLQIYTGVHFITSPVARHVTQKVASLREPLVAELAHKRLLASVSAHVVNQGVRVGRGVRTPHAEVRGAAAVEKTTGPDSPFTAPPRMHRL